MEEEKQDIKKPSLIGRIFRWIGLGLLSILLVIALVFQAAWKITALLLILLLGSTALPKPYRKYFWLSGAAIVVVLIIWVFLPDNNQGWQPYKFETEKEIAALEAKHAIPDNENASIIYDQLSQISEEDDHPEPNFTDANYYDPTLRKPWSSKDYPEIAKWLKTQQDKIELLMLASKFEYCRFPVSDPALFNTDRLSKTRRWGYLLVRAGNNDMGDGHIDQGLQKYTAILQIAKHQYQQVTEIDMLVAIALEALAMKQFHKFVIDTDANQEYFNTIEAALQGIKHDWSHDLSNILEYEKLLNKSEFAKFYEINQKGNIRLNRDPWRQWRAYARKVLEKMEIEELALQAYPSYLLRKYVRAYTIYHWFVIPHSPQKAAKIIEAAYEKYDKMTKPDFNWQKKLSRPSIRLNFRGKVEMMVHTDTQYHRLHDIYLRIITDTKGTQLLIALRRYKNKNNRWPESLDDIKQLAPVEIFIDPYNNGPFVYKLTDDSFTLYSKGTNNIDENGEYDSHWPDEAKPDDWLIWPPRSRIKQKENTNDCFD